MSTISCGKDFRNIYLRSTILFRSTYSIYMRVNIIYESIFFCRSPDSAVFKKYKELMENSQTKWLSDGSIDLKNNFRLSLGAYLPLTDEMIFTM